MQDFRKLVVWEKSHAFTIRVYGATRAFPKEELFVLTSQFRRAASSIPTNIAESCGRTSNADRARFLDMAVGSCCEAEYQIHLATDLGYIDKPNATDLTAAVQELRKMLAAYLARLRTSTPR